MTTPKTKGRPIKGKTRLSQHWTIRLSPIQLERALAIGADAIRHWLDTTKTKPAQPPPRAE